MSDQEIVDACNELARLFYKINGYVVKEGYRFDLASHPQEKCMWYMAVVAYDHIEGTDVEDALNNLENE